MNPFTSLITTRRSTRKFTDQLLTPEQVHLLLESALMAPTSRSRHSWQFILVEEKERLQQLSQCKPHGGSFIAESALAVIVLGDMTMTDVWIEDASIASTFMQLQAEALGLGSCWCQTRGRFHTEEITSEEYIRDLFNIPYQLGVLTVIAFGHKAQEKEPIDPSTLPWDHVHVGQFNLSSPQDDVPTT